MTLLVASSEIAQNDQGHVVVLRGAGGELVGCLHDVRDGLASVASLRRADGGNQPLFASFFQRGIHGFADAVSEDYQPIAGSERQFSLLVSAIGNQSDDGATLVEPFDFLVVEALDSGGSPTRSGAKKQRRAVAAVHVGEPARRRIELRVEKSGVAIRRGSFVQSLIDARHQRRGNPLTGNVAESDAERSARQREEIVIIAADAQRGSAAPAIIHTGSGRQLLWEQSLLNFTGDFDFAIHFFAAAHFH